MTRSALAVSHSGCATVAARTLSRHSPPIPITRMWSAASAPSNALLVWPSIIGFLAEAAGDVVFRQFVAGIREHAIRLAHFDEIAEMEVRRALRNARGLLH